MRKMVLPFALVLTVASQAAFLPSISDALPLKDTLAVYHAGEYRVAADRLERLKQEHPDDPAVRYYLGYAYYRLGDFERARKEFSELFQEHPLYSPMAPH